MKIDLNKLTEEELTELAFGISDKEKKLAAKENVIRKKIAETDKTYLKYPSVLVLTGEISGYPFQGWTKEEIEETLLNYEDRFKEIL